jgi:hypothetical protein
MFKVGKMTEVLPLEHSTRSVAAQASNYNSPTVQQEQYNKKRVWKQDK